MLTQFRVGDEIRHTALMRLQKAGQSSNGGVFARGTLEDNSGTLSFICFERDTVETMKELNGPTPLVVFGQVQADRYGGDGAVQIVVRRTEPVTDADDLSHLLPCTTKNIDEYKGCLEGLIAAITKPHLQDLLRTILAGKTYELYVKHTAAMKMHHAYVGGLLEHSVDVARLAKAMAVEIGDVDIDLVVAGALLHDIGKLEELSGGMGFEYTDPGRLIGHVSLGAMLVDRIIGTQEAFPALDRQALLHVLLSHHGKVENGAPVACVTKESFIVHYADELNSILNQFSGSEAKSGWRYAKMLNRYIQISQEE
ncbi:MAG: HD domain-containing protein [Sporomusaceae bacterium]|nr:HD domain-containing protein [Sporomusaceae bacterium]